MRKPLIFIIVQMILFTALYSDKYSPDPTKFKSPPPEIKELIDKYFTPKNFLNHVELIREGKLVKVRDDDKYISCNDSRTKEEYHKSGWTLYYTIPKNIKNYGDLGLFIFQDRLFSDANSIEEFVYKKLKTKPDTKYKLYDKYFSFSIGVQPCFDCKDNSASSHSIIGYYFWDYTPQVNNYIQKTQKLMRDKQKIKLK